MFLLALSLVSLAGPEAAAVCVNRPAAPEQAEVSGRTGIYFAGDARFQLPAPGPHLVEGTTLDYSMTLE